MSCDISSSERLFGTAMPQYDAGGPLGLLAAARVPDAARAAIAGDNLRRLLGLAPAETVDPVPRPSWPCGGNGFRVFDVHTHLGPWQRIFYAEFDGQRDKRVIVKIMGE